MLPLIAILASAVVVENRSAGTETDGLGNGQRVEHVVIVEVVNVFARDDVNLFVPVAIEGVEGLELLALGVADVWEILADEFHLEEGVLEDVVDGGIGDGQFGASCCIGRNLVGVVDECDGVVAEYEVLGGEHVHRVEKALVVELVEIFGSGFLEQDLQKHLVELVLIAGGEDIGEEELTACGRVEIHRQVLVDAVGTSLVVVEVDMIDGYALVTRGDICGDDVVVFVPGALGCVGTVLVVEGQEILPSYLVWVIGIT